MQDNTRYCVKQWRKAGARVLFVELALEDEPFVFHPSIDEGHDDTRNLFHTLIQLHVQDVMWYKEMALNIALRHVEQSSPNDLVAWFDNDVFLVPPSMENTLEHDWWVQSIEQTFAQNPTLSFLQPFSTLVLTTETVRNSLLGHVQGNAIAATHAHHTLHTTSSTLSEDNTETTTTISKEQLESTTMPSTIPPSIMTYEEAINKCTRMARIRKSIMCDPHRGVTGCAWVGRAKHIKACGFFSHSYMGGGDDLMLNLLLGAMSSRMLPVIANDMQRYYFLERGPFARHIMRYRKKWQMQTGIPARCAYLPCTLIHLHHGELEKKNTHILRYAFFQQRQFNATRHVCAHQQHRGIVQWSDSFRRLGINQMMLTSFERSQTVRDRVLLRMAKTQKCLTDMKKQMSIVVTSQSTKNEHATQNHQHVSNLLQKCLSAMDSFNV